MPHPARWAAGVAATAHVFVDTLDDRLDIGGPDGHHLARVLRLRAGEVVTVADGRGTWRAYDVAAVASSEVTLEAVDAPATEPQADPRLAVAFSLTKADKPELTIQKLTELGVDRILPVLAERSIARPVADRTAVLAVRWRKVALGAARQCRRARLPDIAELTPLSALAGHPGLVVAEWGGGPADDVADPPGGELLVVVGPEGGLSDGEVETLRPWARLGLGPHVLRAETAALAAAAVVRAGRRSAGANAPEPD